jgi:nicotinate phosphoribosyltransferase
MNLINRPIISSMLDDDLYKLCMNQAFMELFPDANGVYKFTNRGKHRFSNDFIDSLNYQIHECLPNLKATDEEISWLKKTCPFLKPWYLDSLKNFRYDTKGIKCCLDHENNLIFEASGKIANKMMLEVKMMAIISELYFELIDTKWSMDSQRENAHHKASKLNKENCNFVDFGTRRRRNFKTQKIVVASMSNYNCFKGTSNVYLSYLMNLTPKGTQAHEWFQAMQALEGIRNSNYYAMNNWVRVYNGSLGIALTDTLGTEQFLKNFSLRYAKLFDGVRWDSGDPYWYTDLIVDHYKKLGIDPLSKTIVYSNALDCEKAIEIKKYCEGKINCSFGIGTKFTNDFGESSTPLNMVIKLWSVNGIPVVKLSDDQGKENGDKDAVRVTKWICKNTPLD